MNAPFNYTEFTTRNIGFVTEAEQERLRDACIFVCGTGGMGGAALLALVRAGIGHLIIADIDEFEVSNLNRQVFATLDTIGRDKAEASAQQIRRINPEIDIKVLGHDWPASVEDSIRQVAVVINGTDDLGASLLLYRTARAEGRPVIDAYAAPLPSIYVTRPQDQMPEERLGYPTIGKPWNDLSAADRDAAFQAEVLYVLVHSSSRHHVDLEAAGEVAAGRASRMSFAPMVISTGMLMTYEAVALVLGHKTGTDNRGWFFNPHKPGIERPRSAPVAAIMHMIARRFLNQMMGED